MFRFLCFTECRGGKLILACFWVWHSGKTAVSIGKSFFVGVFVWALAPLCVWFAVFCFDVWFVVICLHTWTVWVLVQISFLTAYAHVRTEPQCDIGHTRGKKITDFCMALLWSCCLVVCFTVVIPIPWWCRLSSVWYIADAYELISWSPAVLFFGLFGSLVCFALLF